MSPAVRSILVAEDEFLAGAHLRAALSKAGYRILGPASTARDCVELARSGDPDVVLMDIRLAGDEDGIEAARRIREFSRAAIVFMSGYQWGENRERAEALAPLAFLVKPVLLGDIQAILARLEPSPTGA